jgi:hypothetical protein
VHERLQQIERDTAQDDQQDEQEPHPALTGWFFVLGQKLSFKSRRAQLESAAALLHASWNETATGAATPGWRIRFLSGHCSRRPLDLSIGRAGRRLNAETLVYWRLDSAGEPRLEPPEWRFTNQITNEEM